MATVFELVSPKIIAAKYEETKLDRVPYLGEAFFSERKELGTELSYLEAKAPTVKLLNASSYDAKTIYLGREGVTLKTTEIPFFKNGMTVNEKMTIELNNLLAGANENVIKQYVNRLFDDQMKLLEAAALRREQLRMMLMTTGKIAISDNGQVWEYDFGVPAANKVESDWETVATADPIADIISWQDQVETATGVRPSRLLMNRKTLSLFAQMSTVKNKFAFYALTNAATSLTNNQAQRIIEQETNTTIYVYDKGYTDPTTNTFKKFVPDLVVVLFPEGYIGEGVFGTTPEESMLINSMSAAEVGIADLGVAVTKWQEPDSVLTRTKASMSYLPVLNDANTIIIASVKKNA